MPPGYVRTIRDEILYEYAKLISRSAFGTVDYAFVWNRFSALKDGSATISGTNTEWRREQELPRSCVFCGTDETLQLDHLIPRSRGGADSADNAVLSCRTCNSSRGDRGVFQWLGLKRKEHLHRLVAGKYLKMLLEIHESAGTLDIDRKSITTLCPRCRNGQACREWNKVGKLTCLCLESPF